MRYLRSSSLLATALLFGALGCSESSDDPDVGILPNTGMGGTLGNAGAAGAGGAASPGGAAGLGGAASGAAGTVGEAGTGAAATDAGVGGDDAGFPVPDKLAALTFDDGPNVALTGAVLDKLELHQVPASFFLIGQNINAGTQPVLARAAALGCEFENHSLGFTSLAALTAEGITASVDDTTALIEQFTDDSPQFFRPPNLDIDQAGLMYATIDMPFAGGLVGLDFPAEFGGNPTVEGVTNTVLNGVQDGSIILLHDVQPALDPQPTPDALDIIIPELKRRGYELVTLRELFERRGVDPNSQQDVIWNVVPPQ